MAEPWTKQHITSSSIYVVKMLLFQKIYVVDIIVVKYMWIISDVIGSKLSESQSYCLMHDAYVQFPVYFTTLVDMMFQTNQI